jgi:hypothetical protein
MKFLDLINGMPHYSASCLQHLPVWERKVDNILFFGHAMPINAEVASRRCYLDWCTVSWAVLSVVKSMNAVKYHGTGKCSCTIPRDLG